VSDKAAAGEVELGSRVAMRRGRRQPTEFELGWRAGAHEGSSMVAVISLSSGQGGWRRSEGGGMVATDEFELSSGAAVHGGRWHGSGRLSLSSVAHEGSNMVATGEFKLGSGVAVRRERQHGGDHRCGWWWSHLSLSSKLSSGVANSGESVVLERIDSDPEFRVAGKIEVLRRIVFVKSGLRIKSCGSFTA
jgi:hypothetical protein